MVLRVSQKSALTPTLKFGAKTIGIFRADSSTVRRLDLSWPVVQSPRPCLSRRTLRNRSRGVCVREIDDRLAIRKR